MRSFFVNNMRCVTHKNTVGRDIEYGVYLTRRGAVQYCSLYGTLTQIEPSHVILGARED